MNGEFSVSTKTILAKRANERCTICNKPTSKPHLGDNNLFINLGEAAHIKGARPAKHNRFDESMTDTQRSDISNGLWLCTHCHKEIDSDSEKYTVDILLHRKEQHEKRVAENYYEIQWKEYLQLKERVDDLKKLIIEKETVEKLRDSKVVNELTVLKEELERAQAEKVAIENSYDQLLQTVAGFDQTDSEAEIQSVLQDIQAGDFETARSKLDAKVIEEKEKTLARKRLLIANLDEVAKDYDAAEKHYCKASNISESREFLEQYIGYLVRRGKLKEALEICIARTLNPTDRDMHVWLLGASGEISAGLNHNDNTVKYFTEAKMMLDEEGYNSIESKIRLAKILNALGTANKNLGRYDEALQYFEKSLNFYWEGTIKHQLFYPKELGGLFVNIAAVYFINNNPEEALRYYERAENAFKEGNCYIEMLVLALNSIDAYLHPKINNRKKAREIIDKILPELEEGYSKYPLHYVHYYIGVLAKSGSLHATQQHIEEAKNDYELAISIHQKIYAGLRRESDDLAMLYFNYAVLLVGIHDIDQAIPYCQKAEDILLNMPDTEHSKHEQLARLYLFRANLLSSNAENRILLEQAQKHVILCNFEKSLAVRILKMTIDHQIEELDKG